MGNPKGYSVAIRGNKLTARLYQTDIVEIEGHRITLRNGNWQTNHTKKCINLTLQNSNRDVRLYQKDSVWYVEFLNECETVETVPFQDGMILEVA